MVRYSKLGRLIVTGAALFAVPACNGFLGSDHRPVEVSMTLQRSWDRPPVFEAEIGGRRVQVTGHLDGQRTVRIIQAPRSGELPVTVRLLDADGGTLASTQYTQLFESKTTHWVAVSVGTRRPLGICIGELLALPTRFPTDTVFVMYGSIPDDAVC